MIEAIFPPRALPERLLSWAIALAGAVLLQAVFTLVTALSPARDSLYGGPFALGACHHDFLFSPANSCTFGPSGAAALAANVVLTWAMLGGVGERYGPIGVVVGTLAAFGALRFSLRAVSGAVELLPTWLAMIPWAVAGAFVVTVGLPQIITGLRARLVR